ncbi:PQQ-dependent sugar dehydrogenase [Catenovulum sp. SX2]|uniref:PQQ-dependent sugar dehydrogenase n=1 Tax=Catenovulum sp. SX2 TaxID=3398614 RepID=UPI003F82C7EE
MKLKLIALAVAAFSAACAAKPTSVEDVYAENCASCHGKKLQGGMGPSLIDDEWKGGSSATEIAKSISDGNPQMGMPAWKHALSDELIQGLAVYIQEQKGNQQPQQVTQKGEVFQSQDYAYSLKTVAEFDEEIWGMSFLPNGDSLITEKAGDVWLLKSTGEKYKIADTPTIWLNGQGGLLDVLVHPEYPKKLWIYLTFAENTGAKQDGKDAGMTTLMRGQIINNKWVNQEVVYRAPHDLHIASGAHFGSRIVIRDGYVYFSIGDRGRMHMAQDLSKANGKIHRLTEDGKIPADNPFVNTKDALPTIWSYGHRNPQGLALHPVTNEIWESEHGPRGGDEINLIEPSLNYGWPVITYGINYNGQPISDKTHQEGMQQPKHYYVPSIATAGMEFYQGKTFAKWQNNLLLASLAKQELRRLVVKDQQVISDELLVKDQGRIRDVAVSPAGEIFIAVRDGGDNKVLQLVKQN